jgi:hypothetical protein
VPCEDNAITSVLGRTCALFLERGDLIHLLLYHIEVALLEHHSSNSDWRNLTELSQMAWTSKRFGHDRRSGAGCVVSGSVVISNNRDSWTKLREISDLGVLPQVVKP